VEEDDSPVTAEVVSDKSIKEIEKWMKNKLEI
jgi:hypothetical protein